MAGVLIRMKLAVLRNSLGGKQAENLIGGLSAGLLLAAVTLYFATRADLLGIALAFWVLGWMIGPAMFGGGDDTLRPEIFAQLPVSPRRLAAGLLGASFVGAAPVVSLVAFAGLVVLASRLDTAAVVVAVPAVLLQLTLAVLLSRVTTGVINRVMRTRAGAAATAVFSALVMALTGSGWALFPAAGSVAGSGLPDAVSASLRLLPSGWSLAAVEAAGRSDWLIVAVALTGLILLCGLLLWAWAALLRQRMTTRPSTTGTRRRAEREYRARGPLAAVFVKETRTWLRDFRRVHFAVFAFLYAVFFCVLPLAAGSSDFLPWTGLLFVLIAAAMSAGLYGEDGTALWITLTVPGASGVDVRGRQLAWLALVAPPAVGLTVALTAATGHHDRWPLLLALLPAVLGGCAGLVVLLSLVRLVPITDPHKRSGNLLENPTDFGQVLLCLVLAAAAAGPAFLVAQRDPVGGIITGVVSGIGLFWLLGRLAQRRLDTHGPEVLHLMRSGPTRRVAPSLRPVRPLHPLRRPAPIKTAGTRTAAMFLLTVCWIPLFPQGLVPIVMLLTGEVERSWFLALHLPSAYQWPVALGMTALGLILAGTGVVLKRRSRPATA
ncbi:hypothetical protein AB0M47_21255 [Hamadaea sp. NPDC051192]|uniref:hypothetical protein n=1 Tax=Hamadaea sp. NPDC051192 TaxID=3154940 RepID=UPI0034190E20